MRLKMCLGVKHTFTNGGECKGWSPMTPKCTSTKSYISVGVANVQSMERQTSTKLGPHVTIKKVLKCRCSKCPPIIHLDLIGMNYDQKKGWELNYKFAFQPQTPWKQGSNGVWLEHVIHHWKDIFKSYEIFFVFSKWIWFENNMNAQHFGTSKAPILGPSLESFGEKWDLDVAPTKKHKIYHREGNVSSSQRFQVV